MVRRMLRWLLDVEAVDDTSARALRKRLVDLEDDFANLERRFDRLRGQVTGGIRHEEDYEDEGPAEDEYEQLLELREKHREEARRA